MSLLRDFEQRLENLLEGFFVRQFKSGVQPVEIAKKLAREMDSNRTISVSKIYVPNRYIIRISQTDAERLKLFEKALVAELQDFLVQHAKKEGYALIGKPQIKFEESAKLALGEINIESKLEGNRVEPIEEMERLRPAVSKSKTGKVENAYLVRIGASGDTRILLSGRFTKIGRAVDNDIVIPDPNVSRHHARVENTASKYLLKDLGSTNGTFVNGERITEYALRDGDTVVIGTTKLQFRREIGV